MIRIKAQPKERRRLSGDMKNALLFAAIVFGAMVIGAARHNVMGWTFGAVIVGAAIIFRSRPQGTHTFEIVPGGVAVSPSKPKTVAKQQEADNAPIDRNAIANVDQEFAQRRDAILFGKRSQ